MFELPSLWNLIVSTAVFFAAIWYLRRYLDEQGIPEGMTRRVLVFMLASLLSWGAGAAVDKIVANSASRPSDATQMLRATARQQP